MNGFAYTHAAWNARHWGLISYTKSPGATGTFCGFLTTAHHLPAGAEIT
jgi:hypothetical protein